MKNKLKNGWSRWSHYYHHSSFTMHPPIFGIFEHFVSMKFWMIMGGAWWLRSVMWCEYRECTPFRLRQKIIDVIHRINRLNHPHRTSRTFHCLKKVKHKISPHKPNRHIRRDCNNKGRRRKQKKTNGSTKTFQQKDRCLQQKSAFFWRPAHATRRGLGLDAV